MKKGYLVHFVGTTPTTGSCIEYDTSSDCNIGSGGITNTDCTLYAFTANCTTCKELIKVLSPQDWVIYGYNSKMGGES